ncbi:MAG: DNA-directed RNA polymerase subunit alpha [Rubrobacter sp.]|jgi:DNA-directed RNA polymerase subunit alpha|nr:DNA-directed RNA polymerase subunit alpha [Rubrobacter sp.]MDQ3376912.1 DNA-directed RNA polymerase subunit alpha [Actinomycetota bacterium]
MLDIAPPRFRVEEEEGQRGTFVAEPLPRGLGHTIGNSLRRVMLSGLTGAAVTKIRVEGVSHEFSTVPGVKEDVVDIILNIKGLKFKLERDEPIELQIQKDGPGEVTAADIEVKADVEIVDPGVYLASVSEGGHLDMRLTIELGQGYRRAEGNKSDADPIGVIAVDSLFSPVQRVNYSVTETRAGARADLDSLRMEVFTDGRIEPQEAVQEASKQLMDYLGLFTDGYQVQGAVDGRQRGGRAVIQDERPVEDLELTVRSYNCLKREGVDTIGQLATMTEEELMNIRNLGMKSVDEIRSKLLEYGYALDSEGVDEAR